MSTHVSCHSSAKVEHGENTADILLSLKNVVVHPSTGASDSPPESQSSSPGPGQVQIASSEAAEAGFGQQVNMGGHWEQETTPPGHTGYPVPYNYSMEGFGWGAGPSHSASFSPRGSSGGGLGSPHHFPTMSVNVSMNIPMHGVPGYDHIQDQWPQGGLDFITMEEKHLS